METKRLQSNFTTPEQAKRLLELGVPADSADCMNFGNADIFQIPFQRPFSEHLELHVQEGLRKMYTPCWSVGRLIEIYATSTDCSLFELPLEDSLIDTLIDGIEWNRLDFSKLNELC